MTLRTLPASSKLWAKGRSGEALGEIEFRLPTRAKEAARLVGQGGLFPVTCVIAQEIGAPQWVKPIEWHLLTNREADTASKRPLN